MSQTETKTAIAHDADTELVLSLVNEPTSTGNLFLPGASAASTAVLIEKLKHNYLHNDAFFQGVIYHNHSMDHTLAVWALGGSPEAVAEVYKSHDYTELVHPSPEAITDANFFEHLGDAKFYNAYVVYFCKALVAASSPAEVLQRFLFSPVYNHNANLPAGAKQALMIDRLMGGIVHPLIHLGYGAEFGIKQQLAEGLAYSAIHDSWHGSAFPQELFTTADPYARGLSGATSSKTNERPPFLTLLADILADKRLAPEALDLPFEEKPGEQTFVALMQAGAGKVVEELVSRWYDSWTAGVSEEELEERLEGMVEDTVLTMSLIYGAGGVAAKGDRVFNACFITMHFVTSANFLPTFALRSDRTRAQTLQPPLPLASRLLLVRAFLSVVLLWFIGRPMPTVEAFTAAIPELYAATDALLSPPAPAHASAPGETPKRDFWSHEWMRTMPVGARAWPKLFASAASHPNEHLPKLTRALGVADASYGRRGQGQYAGPLGNSEILDGTLFLRVALLSTERLGWAMEDTSKPQWDRDGYWLAAAGKETRAKVAKVTAF
ncbi:hypothetical protein PENSPDRAFT_731080 [Peniophora sp. CONT]|nr:hypothetical protein PENSPDRAFT_731080 [Peniophora sp. CONT]